MFYAKNCTRAQKISEIQETFANKYKDPDYYTRVQKISEIQETFTNK